ncbi:GntR family transcriptional regulator [Arthrobacter sp. 18067]|uniref:GntR family transcriptional regulator n=1 Tax=Arthrobacter sp. 18067 TaxID=2681413 RepID=UPI00135BE3E7|nr:GntR family transcriptional regulator [Arthrobacter sp. 18067]
MTLQAAAQIRGLIIDRVLLPGEKILQVELAEQIGVSRSPLREALRTLEAEDLVTYEANRGYVVARFDDDDLIQILGMRSLLEGELLRTVVRPTADQLVELERINTNLKVALEAQDVTEIVELNRSFHFSIFELSPLKMVRREVLRLWQLSEAHSAAWWRGVPEVVSRIVSEHEAIIETLRRYDVEDLVVVCEAHRVGGHGHSRSGMFVS